MIGSVAQSGPGAAWRRMALRHQARRGSVGQRHSGPERSGARRTLRHRGVSHSVWALAGLTAFAWLVLDALARRQGELFPVPPHVVVPWTIAFAAGGLSHLLGDACTRAGIQPFLPLSRVKVWVLPRWLRGRSDGWLNAVAVVCAAMVLGGCLGMVLSR